MKKAHVVDTTDVLPIDEEDIPVPAMTEDRMYEMDLSLSRHWKGVPLADEGTASSEPFWVYVPPGCREETSAAGVSAPPLRPNSPASPPAEKKTTSQPAPSKGRPSSAATNATTSSSHHLKKAPSIHPQDELMRKLMAYYKVVHGTTMRVHEEIARNYNVNIGEIGYLENKLYEEVVGKSPELKKLPPLAVLVLHLFTLSFPEAQQFFTKVESQLGEGNLGGNLPNKGIRLLDPELRTVLLRTVRLEVKLKEEGPGSQGRTNTLFQDILNALQSRNLSLMNRWIGVATVLVGSLEALRSIQARLTTTPPAVSPREQPVKTSPPKGASKQPVIVVPPTPANTLAMENEFCFNCEYSTVESALGALERLAAVPNTELLDLPFLQPLATVCQVKAMPFTQLGRLIGHAEPNLEKDENGEPRTQAERARLRCAGWALPSTQTVAPTAKEKGPKAAALVAATAITGTPTATPFVRVRATTVPPSTLGEELQATIGSGLTWTPLVDLKPFTLRNEHFVVSVPFLSTASVVDFEPSTLSVRMNLVGRTDAANSSLHNDYRHFLEDVLCEAHKIATVTRRITNRLSSQFVKPHYCHQHPKQKNAHVCQTCMRIICSQCLKESHLDHQVQALAAVCIDDITKFEHRRRQLKQRLEALHALMDKVPHDEAEMHEAVDTGFDVVKQRVEKRRAVLHADAEQRAQRQRAQLEREYDHCKIDQGRLEDAANRVGEITTGTVNSSTPQFKMHKRMQVKDMLRSLRLPTKEIRKLVELLTWSNPSIYLTRAIYPPENVD